MAGFGISGVDPPGSAARELVISEGNTLRGWDVARTGSGSCPMAGFGIRGDEPLDSATRMLSN
jgi:hypothetical protein